MTVAKLAKLVPPAAIEVVVLRRSESLQRRRNDEHVSESLQRRNDELVSEPLGFGRRTSLSARSERARTPLRFWPPGTNFSNVKLSVLMLPLGLARSLRDNLIK
eukprot:SAG31_NODE_8188_length_1500_cov_3.294076_2_plen_103_part_01